MRYDTKVIFIKELEGGYDPEAGEFKDDETNRIIHYCHVQDLSDERTLQLYGRANIRAFELYHLGAGEDVGKVELSGKLYYVVKQREVRNKAIYIVSESKVT